MKVKVMLTKEQAIANLRELDHCFLMPSGVEALTKPFGFVGTIYKTKDTRSQFKGLHIPQGKEGQEWEGQDADRVALEIAKHLGLNVPDMFGKGSQLRIACEMIEEYLSKS